MRNRTISRPPAPPATPFPVADRWRNGDPYTPSPRAEAIRHLRTLLDTGRAGLDPNDPTVLIIDVRPHEQTWARSVCELAGLYMGRTDDTFNGTTVYRMLVEADVRAELRLDEHAAPIFGDTDNVVTLFDAADLADGERMLADPQSPLTRAVADLRDAQRRMLERSAQS